MELTAFLLGVILGFLLAMLIFSLMFRNMFVVEKWWAENSSRWAGLRQHLLDEEKGEKDE